jgi:hypothetical protein
MNPTNPPLEGTKLANFTPVQHVPELQIIDLKEGGGDVVAPGATITAHYVKAARSSCVKRYESYRLSTLDPRYYALG